MLQISTGKFFRPVELYETLHRTVFYTNYRSFQDTEIETPIGKLCLSTGSSGLATITCETVERLEAVTESGEREVMISTSGAELLDDIAAILSFALDITCTRDPNLTTRLVGADSKRRGQGKADHFIDRTFDADVFHKDDDDTHIQDFFSKLMGLERTAYEHAIRAIRRYVLGMHRIVDEDSLAYALFVMSIESLLEEQKSSARSWSDVNAQRRNALDKALKGAPDDITVNVKAAIAKNEKASIGPQFVEFVMDHLTAPYFREGVEQSIRPISVLDIPHALKRAYSFRSRYVHSLKEIPAILRHNTDKSETAWEDSQHVLTFQGMTRLARHVIFQYVKRGPKCEAEEFNYRGALPNIVQVPMSPHYWIWRSKGYNSKTARRHLSGFLEQIAGLLTHNPEGPITDLTDVMKQIERQVPSFAKASNRMPMLVAYYLYNSYAPDSHKRPDWSKFLDRYKDDLALVSIDATAAYLATRRIPEWSLADAEKLWGEYLKQRSRKSGLKLPSIFEAAFLLSIAEMERKAQREEGARLTIGKAVEAWPACDQLQTYEAELADGVLDKIFWPDILITKAEEKGEAT